MGVHINLDEDLKKKLSWSMAAIFGVLGVLAIFGIKSFDKEKNEQVVTVEKITAKYDIMKVEGPSPFIITVKDENGKVYKDSFVSSSCPQFESKAQNQTKLTLTRFTNVKIVDNTQSYFFKGAYEQLCTNIKFDPKSGDNFLKSN